MEFTFEPISCLVVLTVLGLVFWGVRAVVIEKENEALGNRVADILDRYPRN